MMVTDEVVMKKITINCGSVFNEFECLNREEFMRAYRPNNQSIAKIVNDKGEVTKEWDLKLGDKLICDMCNCEIKDEVNKNDEIVFILEGYAHCKKCFNNSIKKYNMVKV